MMLRRRYHASERVHFCRVRRVVVRLYHPPKGGSVSNPKIPTRGHLIECVGHQLRRRQYEAVDRCQRGVARAHPTLGNEPPKLGKRDQRPFKRSIKYQFRLQRFHLRAKLALPCRPLAVHQPLHRLRARPLVRLQVFVVAQVHQRVNLRRLHPYLLLPHHLHLAVHQRLHVGEVFGRQLRLHLLPVNGGSERGAGPSARGYLLAVVGIHALQQRRHLQQGGAQLRPFAR
mmetsp:Transcript_40757/g.73228  ORF Transcript_40757/g.73228 Transcript_40757/m.73228 type:complete len:229 (+) Transcript_40757:225-911(+)